jgi:hypothetical protein
MKKFNYEIIYEFCKIRNKGPANRNGTKDLPPRVKFIIDLLKSLRIYYHLDSFHTSGNILYNIYLIGASNNWVMAHHDILNPEVDNANDNSCSVINCIALKLLDPKINVALVDSEEVWSVKKGSQRFSELALCEELKVSSVLNLELTGIGGKNFFLGNYNTNLTEKIKNKFNCDTMDVPFNDCVVLRENKIDCALINPLPPKNPSKNTNNKILGIDDMDTSILNRCHTTEDKVENIKVEDMKEFTEEVLLNIH